MPSFSFSKNERLKSQKVIQRLFKEGKSLSSFPLRLIYLADSSDQAGLKIQFAATVPKKKFPKAVRRNRIRRQIKECYRLDKNLLAQKLENKFNGSLSIMIIYVAPEALPYAKMERAMKYLLQKLAKTILA